MNISIVGSGTAGLSTAYLLSKYFNNISIHERSKNYGWRYKDSIQSIRNYEDEIDVLDYLNANGLNFPKTLFYPIHTQIRYASNGSHIRLVSKSKPSFYNLLRGRSRDSLDYFLFNSIKDKVNLNLDSDGNKISNYDIKISARGSSHLKKGFEIQGVEFHGISTSFPENTIVMVFDNKIAPGGYISFMPFKSQEEEVLKVCILVGWEKRLKKDFTINSIWKELNNRQYLRPYLNKFLLESSLSAYGRGGFINVPESKTIFIGEEFGALDSALGFGNINAFRTSIAVNELIQKKLGIDEFMNLKTIKLLRKDLKRSILRRYAMRYLDDNYYINYINKLNSLYGEEIDYSLYKQIKNNYPLKVKFQATLDYILMRS